MPKKDYLKELMEKIKEEKAREAAEKSGRAKESVPVQKPEKTEPMPRKEKPPVQGVKWSVKRTEEKAVEAELEEKAEEEMPEEKAAAPEAVQEAPPEKSEAEEEIERASKKIEVASYGNAKIYKIPGKPLLYYFIPVPRPTGAEKTIINTIKEAATRLITISPYRIREPEQRRIVYKQKILEILRGSPELHIPERRFEFYAEAVVREMVGYGIIDQLVRDDRLEEIMVIGPKRPVYLFHRDYEMMTSNIEFYSDQEIEDLINRIAREIGRRVDISAPLLDARLPDGSRVNATIPPASVGGATLTIRKFRADPYSIIDLINLNTMTAECAAFLWLAVEGMGVRPANILIAGGTGSGKTTMLNVMASFIPETERIVTIEDTAELNLPLRHWVRLEARPPGLEGKGELTLDILTKNSLRMRPDRILVGEIRHDEAFTLFTAMNTGHAGSMGTVHSNSPQETIVRVTNPPMNVPEVMLSGLDLILVEHRIHDKKKGTIRRLTEIAEVAGVLERKAQTQTIYERDPVEDIIARTNVPINYVKKLQTFTGLNKKQIDDELKEREDFLKELVKKGIHSMEEVSRETHAFLLQKREA